MKHMIHKTHIMTRGGGLLVAALLVSSMFVFRAQASPGNVINVLNGVGGTPPPNDWNYMITDMNTLAVESFVLPAAGGGNFSSYWDHITAKQSYSITQGGVTQLVEPIQGNVSAQAFYAYDTGIGSGFAPYMEEGISKVYLYEDTATGALSLIIHHNKYLGFVNFWVNMTLSGLPIGADVLLQDDPTSEDHFGLAGGGVALGWWLGGNFSDGGIMGGLNYPESTWNITAQLLFTTGISAWEYQTASGPITLNMDEPLTIRSSTGLSEYLIAQEPKCGYHTSIIVNGTVINADEALVSLAPDDRIWVLFNNTIMPEAEGQYSRISTNNTPPDLGFKIPPNRPVPIQAAWNVDVFNDNNNERIDLVKGKPTSIFVNLTSVSANSEIHASITFPGIGTYDKTVTSNEYANNNIISIARGLIPTTTGLYNISGYYQVDGGPQNPLTPTPVYVKETAPLALYYTSLKKSEYGEEPLNAYDETVQNANDFITATYPVSLANLKSDLTWKTPISGSIPQPNKKDPPEKGMSIDAMAVAQKAYNAYGVFGKSYVGIAIGPNGVTATDYFTYHKKPGAAGVSFGPGCKGVIVLGGYWDAAAHEVGHTSYSLYWGQTEEYNMPEYRPNGKTASGVSVKDDTWVTGYDFMGLAHYKKLDLTWVNHDTYESLFKSMLTSPSSDPEILWASGLIYRNGTVEFPLSWYHYQQGTPDTLTPGNYALRFKASNGTILDTTSFDASFSMQVDPGLSVGQDINLTGFGKVDIGFTPFAFATAYPKGTSVVQVVNMTNPQDPVVLANVTAADVVNVEPPVTTETLTGTAGSNGWYVSDVDVTLTATAFEQIGVKEIHYKLDGTETIVPGNTIGFTISAEGTHSLEYWAVDNVGNEETHAAQTIKIDKTPPTVELTLPQPLLHQPASATWTASDLISDVDGPTSGTVAIDTSSVGPKTVTVTVTDKAGNSVTVTKTCSVKYAFSGFLQPINNDGSSIFKLKSTVPVKFQLKDAQGNLISTAVAKIYLTKITNAVVGDDVEPVSTSAATEGILFRYTGDQYIFNLGTKSLSVGTWQIKAVLDDGTTKTVIISLK